MSTTEPVEAGDNSYSEDRTHPSAEILSALSALNTSSPVKSESQDQPQSQQPQPPQSEYDILSKQVADNPHDHSAWRRFVDAAEATGDIEKISATYDALLTQFPNSAQAQIQYISHFTTNETMFENVEVLFNKFLKSSPCVELWSFYLSFVRRLNSAPSQREIVRKSYEFALNHIGQDKDSGHIWHDYIQLIKSGETSTTWEEQQKMDALRKVYHRAVQIPLDNVERLWQDLETFEMNLNKITAKKFMADLSPAHMQARTVLRQLSNHLLSLYPPSARDEIFLPSQPKFDAPDRAAVGKWKIYLKWEEGNPLEIDEKEKATLMNRVMGVYRKAVVRMRYYTEIWFMAYSWANSVGKHDEAFGFLKSGLEANPYSYLLNFAYAECLEVKKDLADIHTTYDKFLALLRANLEELEQQTNAPTSNGDTRDAPPNPPNGAEPNSQNTSFGSQTSDDKPPQVTELQKQRTEYGLVWIMYMRFARRAEGVKSSRIVFSKARRDRWTPWEVYEADALMEYHSSDDKGIPGRIFEKGLELFGDEIDYVQRYLGFLISINDINNARALFERVIGNFPSERARPLWERWARYEYQYGDLEAALKLEKRMAEVYPVDTPIKRLAQRHIYLGTDAIADRDLGVAFARRSSANGVGRNETAQSALPSSQASAPPAQKRPASPDYRKREDGRAGDYSGGNKRIRGLSPPPGRGADRDRDGRWEGPSRRRFTPPPPHPSSGRGRDPPRSHEREEERPRPALPSILSWFLGELPNPSSFDGPVFRTDDLMNLFRNAVIPSSNRSKSPQLPPPPPRSGRPPPDYGPYQGPNSGPRRRYQMP